MTGGLSSFPREMEPDCPALVPDTDIAFMKVGSNKDLLAQLSNLHPYL